MFVHVVKDWLVNSEIELCRKANRAQHSYRVFTQSFFNIANQYDALLLDVLEAVRVVPDAKVGNVVVQRVTREVSPS